MPDHELCGLHSGCPDDVKIVSEGFFCLIPSAERDVEKVTAHWCLVSFSFSNHHQERLL